MFWIVNLTYYTKIVDDREQDYYHLEETSYLMTGRNVEEVEKKANILGLEVAKFTSETLECGKPAQNIYAVISNIIEPFDLDKILDEDLFNKMVKNNYDLGELHFQLLGVESKEELDLFLNNKCIKAWHNTSNDNEEIKIEGKRKIENIPYIKKYTLYKNRQKIYLNNLKVAKKLFSLNKLTIQEISNIVDIDTKILKDYFNR